MYPYLHFGYSQSFLKISIFDEPTKLFRTCHITSFTDIDKVGHLSNFHGFKSRKEHFINICIFVWFPGRDTFDKVDTIQDFFTYVSKVWIFKEIASLRIHLLSVDHFQSSTLGWFSNPPYFEDWQWSTDKRCTCNEVTS